MKKTNRGFMSGRSGRAARKDDVSLPPELPPSVPAVSVAGSNMLATLSEPLELPPPRVTRVSGNSIASALSLPPELPPSRPAVSVARSKMLATVSEPLELPPPRVSRVSVNNKPSVSPLPPPEPLVRPAMRARLVLGVDATASRQAAWEAEKKLQDVVLRTLPGQVDVSLAVHGGNELKTFTQFTSDAGELAREAAKVECKAGETRLLDILGRVLEEDGVKVVVYIGDMFEESAKEARRLADALRRRGTRVIVLHDTSLQDHRDARAVFNMLAKRTGGAVLPFNISALEKLVELIEAVAVLAVGGPELLDTKKETMPAAKGLLMLIRYPAEGV